MDCSTLQQKLAEYADGSLNPYEMKQIEKHIAACEKCRSYVSELTRTIEALKGLDEIPSPPWLTQKVMQKIRAEAGPKKRLIRKLFFPLHIKLPLEAVATLLIAGAAVLIMKSLGPDLQPLSILTEKPPVQTLPTANETLPKDEPSTTLPDRKAEQTPSPAVRQKGEPSSRQPRVPDQQARPAPPVPAAPVPPAPIARSFEAGKSLDEAEHEEQRQKAASSSARSMLSAEKKSSEMPSVTLQARDIEKVTQEIVTALPTFGSTLLTADKHTTGTTLTIHIDPSHLDALMEQLKRIGRVKDPWPDIRKNSGNKLNIIIIKQ